jgi:hypothetical protein
VFKKKNIVHWLTCIFQLKRLQLGLTLENDSSYQLFTSTWAQLRQTHNNLLVQNWPPAQAPAAHQEAAPQQPAASQVQAAAQPPSEEQEENNPSKRRRGNISSHISWLEWLSSAQGDQEQDDAQGGGAPSRRKGKSCKR